MLQFGIRLGNRVVADDQLFGKSPDAGHLVAVLQHTTFDGMLHLLHKLKIDRLAGCGIDTKDHEPNCTIDMVHETLNFSFQMELKSCQVQNPIKITIKTNYP